MSLEKIKEEFKKKDDYMSEKWVIEPQKGVKFDMRVVMRYWDMLDSADRSITIVRKANLQFGGEIPDKELRSLQMKIRKEKGKIRKMFPMMKWYCGGK